MSEISGSDGNNKGLERVPSPSHYKPKYRVIDKDAPNAIFEGKGAATV